MNKFNAQQFKIGWLLPFCFLLNSSYALADTPLAQKIEGRRLTYISCLNDLSQDIRYRTNLIEADRIDDYINVQKKLMKNIEDNRALDVKNASKSNKSNKSNKSMDEAAERRRLLYLSWVLSRKISECRDLLDGPSKARYIYLVGQQAKTDGRSFETVAATRAEQMLSQFCPTEQDSCKRQIVIKQQIQKDDLLRYLNLLAAHSVQYLAYFGHGWSYGILLAYKDMLVASDWSPDAKISNLQWQLSRNGAIYSDDMNYIGPILARVFEPQGQIEIYACNTGEALAPTLKGQLPQSLQVHASFSGMQFKSFVSNPPWSFSLPSGEQFQGPQMSMVVEVKNAFKLVEPKAFAYSEDFTQIEKKAALKKKNPKVGLDDLSSAVITRVGRKEAWFAWLDHDPEHPQLMVFDERDRKAIKEIFKIPPPGHGFYEDDLVISYEEYLMTTQKFLQSHNLKDKEYYQDLFARITACINEGANKYY